MVPKSQNGPGWMSFFQTLMGSHLPVRPPGPTAFSQAPMWPVATR